MWICIYILAASYQKMVQNSVQKRGQEHDYKALALLAIL